MYGMLISISLQLRSGNRDWSCARDFRLVRRSGTLYFFSSESSDSDDCFLCLCFWFWWWLFILGFSNATFNKSIGSVGGRCFEA